MVGGRETQVRDLGCSLWQKVSNQGAHPPGVLQAIWSKGIPQAVPKPGGPWHLLGPLADVVQAEGGHMILCPHKQASPLLIHQQGFIAAGSFDPESPETMPGLELCRVGTSLRTHQSF